VDVGGSKDLHGRWMVDQVSHGLRQRPPSSVDPLAGRVAGLVTDAP